MKKIKVSVIMPVYNAEQYVAKAIESILNQTLRDFEFIIINDGSTDSSLKIIKNYQDKDDRIKLIDNHQNLGLVKSLNKGLKMAIGEYIARMDADDISLSDRFQKQYTFLENNLDIFLIGSSCFLINEMGIRMGSQICFTNQISIKKKLREGSCIIHPSIMFRNDRQTFYREKMWYSEDYDLYLNLLSRNKKIANIKDILIEYRIATNSICRTHSRKQRKFGDIAIRFYNQRVKFGKDEYDQFNPAKYLSLNNIKERTPEEVLIGTSVKTYFKNGNFKRAREILCNKSTIQTIPFSRLFPYIIFACIPPIYRMYRFCFYKENQFHQQ